MSRTPRNLLLATLLALLLAGPLFAAGTGEKVFPTPDAAVQAVVEALKVDDHAALLAIFGEGARDIVVTADPTEAKRQRRLLYDMSQQSTSLFKLDPKTMIVSFGYEGWNFPIPLVAEGSGWRFDTAQGREELLNRRIGLNELNAIAVCRAYVGAQKHFRSKDPDGDGVEQYARRIGSTPGKHDGLYWPQEEGKEASPFGPFLAESGTMPRQGEPYRGYYFRILTRQGPHAPGGARDYVVDGRMTGGFALVAWPAEHGSLGIMTFLVSQDGVVYQKDLGKDTAAAAAALTDFDPDSTWTAVRD